MNTVGRTYCPIQGHSTALMIAPGQANTRLQGKFTVPLRLLRHAQLRCKAAQSTPNIDDLLDLEAPEIAADMQAIQEKLGATCKVSSLVVAGTAQGTHHGLCCYKAA